MLTAIAIDDEPTGKGKLRITITEVEAMLPVNKFIRIHRSFIAAINKIDKIERHQLSVNGSVLPVGSSFIQNISLLNKNVR